MVTYSQFIVEVSNSEYVHPEAFVRAKRINTDLLAHLEELVTEDRILADLFLVLDSKRLKTLFELC